MYASLTLRSPVQPLIHPSRTWGNVLDNRRVYDIDPDNRYTQELKNQIRDCLRYNPAYRPTAQDLLIDFALHRGRRARGMDTPTGRLLKKSRNPYLVCNPLKDRYRVGLSIKSLPPMRYGLRKVRHR